ncbi:MAG: hypothetical protein MPL62_08060 [Alphaproteobacteria bacterium]|nr:hypothetical protein [Alphaproteobacteria bacterium]
MLRANRRSPNIRKGLAHDAKQLDDRRSVKAEKLGGDQRSDHHKDALHFFKFAVHAVELAVHLVKAVLEVIIALATDLLVAIEADGDYFGGVVGRFGDSAHTRIITQKATDGRGRRRDVSRETF